MKWLIINGDDFGLTEGINRGIVEAYREGILTSASLMPNGLAFENAIALAKENPCLGVGVHLNIVRGKPILSPEEIPSLVNKDGNFFQNPKKLLFGIVSGKINLLEIEKEFRAQIKKIFSAGICPTHLDTEKHIHILPSISKIMFGLAKEFRIKGVRSFKGDIPVRYFFSLKAFSFRFLWILSLRRMGEMADGEISIPDRIYGIFDAGKMFIKRYVEIFSHLPMGTAEIVCHPGYVDTEPERVSLNMGSYYLNDSREKELKTLLSPNLKNLAVQLGIEFISYKDIV